MPELIAKWPGGALQETREKVPSKIAYATENPDLENDAWGYEVYPGLKSCCWTKLLLDRRTKPTEFDDPLLQVAVGGNIMGLPRGKSAEDVVSDFLKFLYKHCLDRLEEKMTPGILAVTPLEFWFTMPAIWSDAAQYATKRAAERAGFGSRGSDVVKMITEPESAAVAALKSTTEDFEDVLEVVMLDPAPTKTDDASGEHWSARVRLRRWHYRTSSLTGLVQGPKECRN